MAEPEDHLTETELQVAAVLDGRASYDHVGPDGHGLVREAWPLASVHAVRHSTWNRSSWPTASSRGPKPTQTATW